MIVKIAKISGSAHPAADSGMHFVAVALALAFALGFNAAHVVAADARTSPGLATAARSACPASLRHTMPRLQDEAPQDLCQYSGRVVLVVNTASKCGFTPQYDGLERLYERYRDRGFVVLGFPSGDFGGQELGGNQEIADFCKNTYAIKFPMFAKSQVKGPQANPVFAALIRDSGEAPKWNFHKYLLGRDGRIIGVWSSLTDPESSRIKDTIDKALAAPPA